MTHKVTRVTPEDWLRSDGLRAMDFLNVVSSRFPQAISLAAGRPPDALIQAVTTGEHLSRGVAESAEGLGLTEAGAWTRFGQYADTNGVIEDALKKTLISTEDVDADEFWLQTTNGIQEALLIECLRVAAEGGGGIAFDPTYVGFAGAAGAAGLPLFVVERGAAPVEALRQAAIAARAAVRGPILCYLIADHDNPSAITLSATQRRGILDLAQEYDLLLLEDSAYRMFNYDSDREPSLLSLDGGRNVIHLGSFSKTFMPGVRVGFTARSRHLADLAQLSTRLTAIKSFVSVTTSPIAQAVVSGFLASVGYDLTAENRHRSNWCKRNRDALIAVLDTHLGGIAGVSWSTPQGGFFLTITLPFEVGADDVAAAAERWGVTMVPMAFFSPTGSFRNQVRLSFSTGDAAMIAEGARRFCAYVKSRIT